MSRLAPSSFVGARRGGLALALLPRDSSAAVNVARRCILRSTMDATGRLSRARLTLAALVWFLAAVSCAVPGPESPVAFASTRIEVVAEGLGPDIILIPGLASHPNVWGAVAASLRGRYRLHFVHVKGFAGLRPEADTTQSVVVPVADEIARYVHESHLDRPVMVGHSLGGTVAMLVATRDPAAVGRLVLVDSPPFIGLSIGVDTVDAVRPIADQLYESIVAPRVGEDGDVLEQMFGEMTRSDTARQAVLSDLRGSDRPTVARAFHDLFLIDLRPDLHRITVPTTVLFVVPPGLTMSSEALERRLWAAFSPIKNLRVVRIDDSRHFIQLDQPEDVAEEIEAVLRR